MLKENRTDPQQKKAVFGHFELRNGNSNVFPYLQRDEYFWL